MTKDMVVDGWDYTRAVQLIKERREQSGLTVSKLLDQDLADGLISEKEREIIFELSR